MQTNPCPVWRIIHSCKCMIKRSIWTTNGFQFQPHSLNLSPPGTLHSTQTCSFNIREIKAALPVMICGCWSECAKQNFTFTAFFHKWEIPSFGFQSPFSTELHIIFSCFFPSTAMATSFKHNLKCCFPSWNCSASTSHLHPGLEAHVKSPTDGFPACLCGWKLWYKHHLFFL